jgi:MinD superfamily P-loop ATPase
LIISIASGKGGTGKTTVATNLAFILEKKVNFLDCDVEEPNAHLFLHPEIVHSRVATTPIPHIDQEKCTLCGKCVAICRFKALTTVGEMILTFPELCHSCGGCLAVCPENAVTEITRELGTIEQGRKGHITFTHARLRIGEAMAPPLIRQVRASNQDGGITIIDAPPGTSCPVIAALHGVDAVVLVTEPTPFGLHDLKLAVEAVKLLNIPMGLVVNRSDLGDDKVIDYARARGLPILLKIPFQRKIAEAYSEGLLIAEAIPSHRESFERLYEKITALAAPGAKNP